MKTLFIVFYILSGVSFPKEDFLFNSGFKSEINFLCKWLQLVGQEEDKPTNWNMLRTLAFESIFTPPIELVELNLQPGSQTLTTIRANYPLAMLWFTRWEQMGKEYRKFGELPPSYYQRLEFLYCQWKFWDWLDDLPREYLGVWKRRQRLGMVLQVISMKDWLEGKLPQIR